jgi:UDP-N-acetylglucosamine--N-acetylmuramyl-(pentapeptide) pyrophosphoryl-undecaprenol N-acetylglucosamine transferase
VRAGIAELHGELYVAEPAQPRLLVLGGSQGAQTLNAAVLQSLETGTTLPGDWQIVHQAGDRDVAELRERYRQLGLRARVEPYLREMEEELRSATLVVSRAGAGILAELACARRPAVLLPLPLSSGDHQRRNARLFEEHQAAEVVETAAGTAAVATELRKKLARLSGDAKERQRMSIAAARMAGPDAVQRVVRRVLEIIAAAD